MSHLFVQRLRSTLAAAGVILGVTLLGCGDDDGPDPVLFGRVEGTVTLPASLTAANGPAEGAVVYLRGGDFDSVATTDAAGFYAFDPVPPGPMTISATLGSCLQSSDTPVTVPENATATVDLTLDALADTDTISVGRAGAAYMEIDAATNRVILLYDSKLQDYTPALVVLDLTTGQFGEVEFSDLANVFDLEIISSDEVVFICRSLGGGYGLRFVNPTTLAQIGTDVGIPTGNINHDGRIALDPSHEHVFVTHTTREGVSVTGHVYAVNVAQKELIDADDNVFDGEFAFDVDLVGNSLEWAFNIAFDEATDEILVGNRTDTFVTAIDWNMWGQFDREAGLAVPTDGVRIIDLTPPPPHNSDRGFGVEYWAFGGGKGVAAKSLSGESRIVQYNSGENSSSAFFRETEVSLASLHYIIKVIPERQSWFSMLRDPDPGIGGIAAAIEERDFETLQRRGRYESQVIDPEDVPKPRAFAVDPSGNVLYVAYAEQTFIEVFCLP